MANEITTSISLVYAKTGAGSLSKSFNNIKKNQTASTMTVNVASVGTADEVLALGEVATGIAATMLIKNCDATNYVQVGTADATYFLRLGPGDVNLVTLDGAAIHAKANTGACIVEYALIGV